MNEVVITSAARTAVGRYGGSLKDVAPTELGAIAVEEALRALRNRARRRSTRSCSAT